MAESRVNFKEEVLDENEQTTALGFALSDSEVATAARGLYGHIRDCSLVPDNLREDEITHLVACHDLLIRLDIDLARELSKRVAKIASGWEWPAGAGLEHVPTSELYTARTRQLDEECAGRGRKEK